ncbi:hypothetical protein HZA38_06110 [Candidatus Peregrinibacteria bacterium]|nr:hypothetical protein [Candidatus Peregrinibacteria bacterium]
MGQITHTVDLMDRDQNVDPTQIIKKIRDTVALAVPVLYIQADTGNMSGYTLSSEVRKDLLDAIGQAGGHLVVESVYRGSSARRVSEIDGAYQSDVALIQEAVQAGVSIFWDHSESKRGNFPGRVGVLMHAPARGQNVQNIQSQFNMMARTGGFWFLPDTFKPYQSLYQQGQQGDLHREVKSTVINRIVAANEQNRAAIEPESPLGQYMKKLQGFLLLIPVKDEGSAEKLLQRPEVGVGTIPVTGERTGGPAIRINATGNGRQPEVTREMWKAIAEEFQPLAAS